MPYIEVKATKNRLADPAVRELLIAELTDAACRVFGEDLRPNVWVVVEEVPGQQWGVGGKPLSLQSFVQLSASLTTGYVEAAGGFGGRGSCYRKAPGDEIPPGPDGDPDETILPIMATSRERRTARGRGRGRSRSPL